MRIRRAQAFSLQFSLWSYDGVDLDLDEQTGGRRSRRPDGGCHRKDVAEELSPSDSFSVPAGAWRAFRCIETGDSDAGELLVVSSGDDRVYLEWAPEVVDAARDADWMLDPNGYLAPVGVMMTATEDD